MGKCLALRTHNQLPHSPSSKYRMLCSKGSSDVSFCCCCSSSPTLSISRCCCCSGSPASFSSGCCCCSGLPAPFGSGYCCCSGSPGPFDLGCSASAPASGFPLASVLVGCSFSIASVCSTLASFGCRSSLSSAGPSSCYSSSLMVMAVARFPASFFRRSHSYHSNCSCVSS